MMFHRFKNVLFEFSESEMSGTFDLNAKFMGVNMEKVELVFQVGIASVLLCIDRYSDCLLTKLISGFAVS